MGTLQCNRVPLCANVSHAARHLQDQSKRGDDSDGQKSLVKLIIGRIADDDIDDEPPAKCKLDHSIDVDETLREKSYGRNVPVILK